MNEWVLAKYLSIDFLGSEFWPWCTKYSHGPNHAFYALHAIYVSRIPWKLSFCPLGTEFQKIWGFFGEKFWNCLFWAIFGENFHKSTALELSFLVKTEFLKIFRISVLEKPATEFFCFVKKKAGVVLLLSSLGRIYSSSVVVYNTLSTFSCRPVNGTGRAKSDSNAFATF